MKKRITFPEVEITALTNNGSGVGRHEGKAVFVTHTAPGDVVDVSVRKNKKDFAEGRVGKYHTLSKERVAPFCEYFGECGGCKWQHIEYENQLKWKYRIVEDAFERLGEFTYPPIDNILPSEEQAFYRNKLEFTFSAGRWFTNQEILSGVDFKDRRGLGFHIPGMFDKVLNVKKCFLQADPSNEIRNAIFEFTTANDYSYYHLIKKDGLMRNLIIRTTSLGEVMVIVIFYENDAEKVEGLMNFLKTRFPGIHSLHYIINPKRNDTISDLEAIHYYGKPHIVEQLGDINFKIGTHSFFQTNSKQANRLYNIIADKAALTGRETVLDLYTGLGSIALFLAKNAKQVTGIETIPEAIEDAKENAKFNGIENCDFYAADVRDFFKNDSFSFTKPDVIITDPPRAGMHPDVCKALLEIEAKRIVYVSCNPATQARDLNFLTEKYFIKSIQPVDMFPQTAHVENVVLLELK